PSLLAALARGKEATADIAPVAWLRDELAEAVAESGAIRTAEEDLAMLEEIKAALEGIEPLGKYAEGEVVRIFDEIRGQTLDNYRKLYPNANPALVPARLHLNKGRNQTVEAYLTAGDFELPGQHVANAGMLRALALAFYFALLSRHPGARP